MLWEVLRVQSIGGWVAEKSWTVGASLDGALDTREDRFGGEKIYTTIDQVGDVGFRLFNIVQDSLGLSITHDASEIARSIVRYSCAQYHSLGILLFKQAEHLLERERATDIGIKDEESVWSAFQDGISEVVQAARGTEGLILAEVFDGDVWVYSAAVFDEVAEDALVVVTDDEDFADFGNFGDGGEAVGDDRVACQK